MRKSSRYAWPAETTGTTTTSALSTTSGARYTKRSAWVLSLGFIYLISNKTAQNQSMKATRLHNKALDAFKRAHGYYSDIRLVTHQKWLDGWKRGYVSGRSDQKRAAVTVKGGL